MGAGEISHGAIRPTEVRRASVRRFSWEPQRACPARLPRGGFQPEPAGRLGRMTVHHAITTDGVEAWLYRGPGAEVDQFAARQRVATRVADLVQAQVPQVLGIDRRGAWVERRAAAMTLPSEAGSSIDRYVGAAIGAAVSGGMLIVTGGPRVQPDGAVLVEEASVAGCLEPDERAIVRAIVMGLLDGEPRAVVHAVAALVGARSPDLLDVATRGVLSLRAARTSLGLGLALHLLGAAAAQAGPRSEPLVVVADEVLHRLDFAHGSRLEVESLVDAATFDRAVAAGASARREGFVA